MVKYIFYGETVVDCKRLQKVSYLTSFDVLVLPRGLDLGRSVDGSNSDDYRESYLLAIRHLSSLPISKLQTLIYQVRNTLLTLLISV